MPAMPISSTEAGAGWSATWLTIPHQLVQFRVAADERTAMSAGAAATIGALDRPKYLHRLATALEPPFARRHELDAADQLRRRRVDEQLAGGGQRLQPRRRVDQVAGNQALSGGGQGHRRLAGHDGGTRAQPLAVDTQPADRGQDGEPGMDGAIAVVLAADRRAPDGHHRVADELLERAAVLRDYRPGGLEVGGQDLAHVLRIEPFGEGREADQVDEQHRHQPPLTGGGAAKVLPADRAVTELRPNFRSALGTALGGRGQSLGPCL